MPYFDRFDIVEAWWLYALDYGEYHLVTRILDLIKPGRIRPLLIDRDDLSENGQDIYDALVAGAERRIAERYPVELGDGRRKGMAWWSCACPKEFAYDTGLSGGTIAYREATA